MKKILALNVVLLLVVVSSVFARNIEIRQLDNFSSVKVSHGIKLVLIKGDEPSAKIYINESLSELITQNEDGKLIIRMKEKEAYKNLEATVKLTYTSLDAIYLESAAIVEMKEQGNFSNLKIFAKNSSQLKLDIIASELELEAQGSANVEITVNADKINIKSGNQGVIKLNGSASDCIAVAGNAGIIDLSEMEINSAKIKASSSSEITANIKTDLDVYSGSGSVITITGTPENIKKETATGGKVIIN